jgi:RimJ/RimL family protein N-acetyltransferase
VNEISPDGAAAAEALPGVAAAASASMPYEPVLRGRHCLLRPLNAIDRSTLPSLSRHPAVLQFLHDGFDAESWCALDTRRHGFYRWAIVPATGLVTDHGAAPAAGIVMLFPGRDAFGCNAELGYWLAPAAWSRGIATEALVLLTAWAWQDHTELTRLHADIFAGNAASRRVMQKAGFALEGVRRQAAIKSGAPIDLWQFATYRDTLLPGRVAASLRDPTLRDFGAGATDATLLLHSSLPVERSVEPATEV